TPRKPKRGLSSFSARLKTLLAAAWNCQRKQGLRKDLARQEAGGGCREVDQSRSLLGNSHLRTVHDLVEVVVVVLRREVGINCGRTPEHHWAAIDDDQQGLEPATGHDYLLTPCGFVSGEKELRMAAPSKDPGSTILREPSPRGSGTPS